jgi:hypothetical protein
MAWKIGGGTLRARKSVCLTQSGQNRMVPRIETLRQARVIGQVENACHALSIRPNQRHGNGQGNRVSDTKNP